MFMGAGNEIQIIGKVIGKPIRKEDMVTFNLRDSRTNFTEEFQIVALDSVILESMEDVDYIKEGAEFLVRGPFKINRKNPEKQIICGADMVLPIGFSSSSQKTSISSNVEIPKEEITATSSEEEVIEPLENKKVVEPLEEKKVEEVKEKVEDNSSANETLDNLSSIEEDDSQEVQLGEFGLPHPDSFSIFETTKPSSQPKKSSPQTKKTENKPTKKPSGNGNSKPNGKGNKRFSVNDFKV